MTQKKLAATTLDPHKIQDLLLYRDGLILVLNKPSGIPVHKGSGPYTPFDSYFSAFQYGLKNPPCLAHRLDRETSGCLVLGRHPKALRRLSDLFSSNLIEKTYLALVYNTPNEPEGIINFPIMPKTEQSNHWHMKVDPQGKTALTRYRTLDRFGAFSLLELKPETGRTHQLRIHTDASGFPIVGDSIYFSNRPTDAKKYNQLHLHAYRVVIPYNKNKEAITVTAPLPEHFIKILHELGASKSTLDALNQSSTDTSSA
ncbi:MAG: RluA family pseudouridine synthase [Candidatus Nucleicultricaceae bacterium]